MKSISTQTASSAKMSWSACFLENLEHICGVKLVIIKVSLLELVEKDIIQSNFYCFLLSIGGRYRYHSNQRR